MKLDAARLAASLGPLSLGRARSRVAAHHGRHPRRTAGAGDAFWQYRPLEPGESAAGLDWRKSARSDALLVREREREDPVRLLVWCDGSGSMDYASRTTISTKGEAALALMGALAIAAHAADERVCRLAGPAQPLADILGHHGDPKLPSPHVLRSGDAVLIVGDLLDGDATAWIAKAALAGATGVAIQIIDPAEESFPFHGRLRFEGAEPADESLDLARAEDLRGDYLKAWSDHLERLDAIAAEPGWSLVRHRTDQDPAEALAQTATWLRG